MAKNNNPPDETQYKALFDMAADALLLVSPEDAKIFECNKAALEMFGYDAKEQLMSKTPADISPEKQPDGRTSMEHLASTIPMVMENGSHKFEWIHCRANGEEFPAEILLSLIPFGEKPIIFAATRDITDRIATEKKLRESERWLNLITNNVPMIIFAIDKDGIFTLSEGKGLAALGMEPGQVVGLSSFDVYAETPQVCDEIRQALTGETVTSNVILGPMVFQTTYSPIRNEKDEVTGLIGLSIDVSESRQAEIEREQLQQEVIDAQQRAIVELSTPVIPIMDAPNGAGGIIVMPLIGSIDSMRARDVTRSLLAGIGRYRAKVVIVDVTGVTLMDTGIVNHLNKTIQAARLKGAKTIITGISDAVAETIVDLGIDWSEITTLSDLQTGLVIALQSLGIKLVKA